MLGELIRELGDPINPGDISRKGSKVYIFDATRGRLIDECDGIAVVRMSSEDLKKGDTAYAQWITIRNMLDDRDRHPRWLVVTINNSGARPFDDRVDFEVVIRGMRQGWCEFVAYRDLARVSREIVPSEIFTWLLRETDTALHVGDFNAAVKWRNDEMLMRVRAILAAEERKNLLGRTSDAYEVQWLSRGIGYKGCEPFSVLRAADRSMYQDPHLGLVVVDVFTTYARHENGEDNGCSAVIKMLADRYGINNMRKERILKILDSDFYMHGELVVEYNGKKYDCDPVSLAHPIPLELFETVQMLKGIRQRGSYKEAGLGDYIGNSIRLYHRACRGAEHNGKAIYLRGRRHRGKDVGYTHSPAAPAGRADRSGCSYLGDQGRFSTAEVDRAIVRALLAAAEALPEGFDFTDKERNELAERISDVEGRLENLEDAFWEEQFKRPELSIGDWHDLTASLRRRRRQLRKRERVGDALSRLPRRSPVASTKAELLGAMREVLTEETPEDPVRAVRRKLIVEACVSAAEIWRDENGVVQIILEGPIVPQQGQDWEDPIWPLQAARVFLEQHLMEKIRQAKAENRTRLAEAAGVLVEGKLAVSLRQGVDASGAPLSDAVQTVARRYEWATVCTGDHRRRTGMVKADLPVVRTPRERPEDLPAGAPAWTSASLPSS